MNLAYMPARKFEEAEPAEQQKVATGTICKSCNTENLRTRRFCGKCGSALEAACQVCGFVNAGTDRFCGGCGDDLMETGRKESAVKTAEVPPAGEARPVQARHEGSIESLFNNPTAVTTDPAADGVVSSTSWTIFSQNKSRVVI